MEKLVAEAHEIQSFLEITTSDDPTELTERIAQINVYMARSGKLVADARAIKDIATCKIYEEEGDKLESMKPSIASMYIKAKLSKENHIIKWLDRINSTCVHQGDNIRTQISFAKEQMALTRKGY